MKKVSVCAIAVFLAITIVENASAYHAIATCRSTATSNTAWGMVGNFGLVYGTVSAVASVSGYDTDGTNFFIGATSVSADDFSSLSTSGYANAVVHGYDEFTDKYKQMLAINSI